MIFVCLATSRRKAAFDGQNFKCNCPGRTCICQLVSGQVVYRIEWPGLSLDEKREGFILPCVAYPASDVVLELPF